MTRTRSISPAEIAEIKRLTWDGIDGAEVARRLGRSKNAVGNIIRTLNIRPVFKPVALVMLCPPVATPPVAPLPARALRTYPGPPFSMAAMLVPDPFRERRVEARLGAGRGRV